ncbi:MAG: tRNA (adenosine(37)-N6)-threonylcarbamoyltransferase complex dimerization subunit type 1 TsaB [Planctomycetia bacterium]
MSGPLLVLATTGPEAEVGLALPARAPGGTGSGADARGTLRTGGSVDMGTVHWQLERTTLGSGAARGRDLLPAVQRLLAAAGLAPRDLSAVLVDRGPGSFTGVRLGVTAAKGLALGLGIPVVGVESLEVLGHAAAHDEAAVLAVRDAGRGTVYAALFGPAPAPGAARPLRRAPARLPATDLRTLEPDALLAGEEAGRLAREHGLPQRTQALQADAATVLALGLWRMARGEAAPAAHLVPTYLQASAPERLRDDEAAPPPAAASRPKGPGPAGRA